MLKLILHDKVLIFLIYLKFKIVALAKMRATIVLF